MSKTSEKQAMLKIVNKQQQLFIQGIQQKPFDIVDAMLFMIYQKQTSNNTLFYHSLNILKKSNYNEIEGVLVKMMPVLLKRLTMNEWNILRKFKYLIELIAYSYTPTFAGKSTYIFILSRIAHMQLHIIGYTKIPPALDIIYSVFTKQKTKSAPTNFMLLMTLFQAFNYLPLSYNESAFESIYKDIVSRGQHQNLHFNMMPYRRMSQKQTEALFTSYIRSNNILNCLKYSGNSAEFRKYFIQSQAIQILVSEYFKIGKVDNNNLISYIAGSHILLQKYKSNKQKRQILLQKYAEIIVSFNKVQNIVQYHKTFFNMSNILNFFSLALESGNPDLYHIAKFLNKEHVIHLISTNNELYHVKMLREAVELHSDSAQPQARLLLIKCIEVGLQNVKKFHFYQFSYIIFELMKSHHVSEYQAVLGTLMNSISNQQLQYLVELFNRYPNKTFKLKMKLIDMVWQKDKSFKNIGKFMISSTFKYFTSNRGELTLDMRHKLQALEATINPQDLSQFLLNEFNYMLRFCTHFFYYVSNFSRKLQLILLKNIDIEKYKKEGLGVYITFIEESINLFITSQSLNKYENLIISIIERTKELFQVSTYFKAKEIEWRSILKKISADQKHIMLDEILSDLSNDNYSVKEYHTLVLLIKMSLVGVVELAEPLKEKLQYVISSTVGQSSSKAYELIRLLSVKYYKLGGLAAVAQNNQQLEATMLKALQYVSKQGSQYYLEYVDFAHQFKLKELFKISLQKLNKIQLTPSQIKKVMKYLKHYRGLNLDEIYSKLLASASGHNNLQSISLALPDLLFNFFLAKININNDQLTVSSPMIGENNKQIVNLLQINNKKSNKYSHNLHEVLHHKIIKHLYVCIQADRLQLVSKQIFSEFVAAFPKIKDNKTGFKYQFQQQDIQVLYLAVIKHIQRNQPALWQKIIKGNGSPQIQKQKSFLRQKNDSSKYSAESSIAYLLSKISRNILQKHEPVNSKHLQELQLLLTSKGFKKSDKQRQVNQKFFVVNKRVQTVELDVYIQTQSNSQYGIVYLNKKQLIQGNQVNGKVRFIVKCYQIITGFKIIAYYPGRQLILE